MSASAPAGAASASTRSRSASGVTPAAAYSEMVGTVPVGAYAAVAVASSSSTIVAPAIGAEKKASPTTVTSLTSPSSTM